MSISRRSFLALLGLAPAAALLPKVELPEAPAVDPALVRALENGAASLRAAETEAAALGLEVKHTGDVLILGDFNLVPYDFQRFSGTVRVLAGKPDNIAFEPIVSYEPAPIDPSAV